MTAFRFFGSTYSPTRDFRRLKNNTQRVFSVLLDGQWHTTYDLQRVGGSAARSRVSNLVTYGMPIESRPANANATMWKYRMDVPAVDGERARQVLENDLPEDFTRIRVKTPVGKSPWEQGYEEGKIDGFKTGFDAARELHTSCSSDE